ncbi:SDR family oxidoreductase [Deinococcus pimensis]|uniref:SDR family oxidoreductase n=1 Tax=Deinococcus pimensis TaxID=309888 RepID=UPI0004BABB17|nr:SDR family oxidoreductase [Deinococcus pimensis]
MRVLFIGGTGIISSACTRLALERGFEVYLLNRGRTSARPVPEGARVLRGDIRDAESARAALGDLSFDAVVNWVAFTPEHVETDLALFRGRTRQYVFISSASAYQTPPARLPIVESTPLVNPFWGYSRDKIACEDRLVRAHREEDFPVTIVRPSHTYDETLLPMDGGYTVVNRMRQGRPVIVHGDGTSLWTLTHHRDFALGLVGLLGNPLVLGDVFHITSDEWLTWNQIFAIVGEAAGVTPDVVHVPSEVIASFDPAWGEGLLGDKAHSMIFDNAKIRRAVPDFTATIPFSRGAREVMAWYDADPARRTVDGALDRTMDAIVEAYAPARARRPG